MDKINLLRKNRLSFVVAHLPQRDGTQIPTTVADKSESKAKN